MPKTKGKDAAQTSVTTGGTRDSEPVDGTCPICHRSELVTTKVDGKTATLCPLCNHVLDTAEVKAAAPAKPKRKPAAKRKPATTRKPVPKRQPAKRAAAKRAPAKKRRR
jgi:hypothetical protein